MTPEETLAALLAEDEAPARDPAFTAAVMARVARRRAWFATLASAPMAVATAVVLWALHPLLRWPAKPFAGLVMEGLAPAAATLGMTVSMVLAARLLLRALKGG